MATIYAVAAQFRADLLAYERAALAQLADAYRLAIVALEGELARLLERVEARQAAGLPVSVSWLLQEERFEALIMQAQGEVERIAGLLRQGLPTWSLTTAQMGADAALSLVQAGYVNPPPGVSLSFARLPIDAIAQIVASLSPGSPLAQLLDTLGPAAAKAVEDALITGLATGQNPRTVARAIREALGGNMKRALLIARTEMLRAYREASRRTYQANRDVLSGWVWLANVGSPRVCAFCWAMHGSVHAPDERMATHVQCRCTQAPVTKTWAELGFPGVPETRVLPERGDVLFGRLTPAQQRAILGPAKFRAYQAGDITLADVIGQGQHAKWGPIGWERSLRDILGSRRAQDYVEAAGG